jgi:PPM family protein phosphatase
MPICESCGCDNRVGARFCWNCATPLVEQPTSHAVRPTPEDTHWLAATLAHDDSSHATSEAATSPTTPLPELSGADQEKLMEQSQPAGPSLFGGHYEILDETTHGVVEVVDHEPWRRCWSCGSLENEPGESFCIECGASLEQRNYRGVLMPSDALTGPALIPTIEDDAAQAVLPAVWDRVEENGRTLVLLQESTYEPVQAPLDEVTALRIGRDLAHLMAVLHDRDLLLGPLEPADLELTPASQPRLRTVSNLRMITKDDPSDVQQVDLQELAGLLERLTATPRTTQRLNEDEALEVVGESDLTTVLRQVRTEEIGHAAELAQQLEALLAEHTRPLALHQRVGALSDTGMLREHNEDSLLTLVLGTDNASNRRSWGCYIVADGMGGHAAGEVASGLAIRGAVEEIMREYLTVALDLDADYDEGWVREIVRRAALQANQYVLNEGQARGNDMGTTLTMALVVGDRATIANVGDSRTYRYRDGKLQRITRDHSLVMRLVEIGQISEDDIYSHPQRSAVLRSLGDKADIEVDLFNERLQPGDALLLCSDGQWEMTHDPEMEQILSRYAGDPQQICQQLVAAANQAGGEDNITSVLVMFE